MAALSQLETALADIFIKKAPKLPENIKKIIVQYLPWVNLVLGILTLWAAWTLWHWAHLLNNSVNVINSLNANYGTAITAPAVQKLTAGVWLSLLVLVVEAVLYIAAFPGTRDKKKAGWNLLFYALLVNALYGFVVMFTSYGGVSNLLGYVIGSAIGLYFLFQIRSAYTN